MNQADAYVDLKGREWPLRGLDEEERRLVADLQARARSQPSWNDFDNYWTKKVTSLYDKRGLTRAEAVRSTVFRIAQDLSGRIAIAAGLARPPDYRDELEEIIRSRFRTRREFCEATGLAEDMLSHVLARRKHLSMEALTQALDRIGYTVRLAASTMTAKADPNGAKGATGKNGK